MCVKGLRVCGKFYLVICQPQESLGMEPAVSFWVFLMMTKAGTAAQCCTIPLGACFCNHCSVPHNW